MTADQSDCSSVISMAGNYGLDGFSLGKDIPNLGDIMEVKKGCLAKVINMLFKQHILIKNNSDVTHSCTGGQQKISKSVPKVFGTKNNNLCFTRKESVCGHPGLNVLKTCLKFD